MRWYSKYLEVYNKPFTDEQDAICKVVKKQIGKLQAENPVVTVSVIAYNEERHLLACLWALSDMICKYPLEIIGVNNDSKDRTAEIFERWGVRLFELMRDTHIWIQHFKRPELSVRGLVFAFDAELGRQVGIRTDIIRGEDGYLALQLKNFGRIVFVRKRRARAVTGYGTMDGDGTFWQSFWFRIKKYSMSIGRIFFSKKEYKDEDSNLVEKNRK